MGYKDTLAQIETLRKQAFAEAGAEFAEHSKGLFGKHPKLESFSWTQYTPYFNDGEECVFGVNRENLDFKYGGEEYEDIGEWNLKPESSRYATFPEDFRPAAADVLDFVGQFSEDDLREMFGDHKRVVVTAAGADAQDYDHE